MAENTLRPVAEMFVEFLAAQERDASEIDPHVLDERAQIGGRYGSCCGVDRERARRGMARLTVSETSEFFLPPLESNMSDLMLEIGARTGRGFAFDVEKRSQRRCARRRTKPQ